MYHNSGQCDLCLSILCDVFIHVFFLCVLVFLLMAWGSRETFVLTQYAFFRSCLRMLISLVVPGASHFGKKTNFTPVSAMQSQHLKQLYIPVLFTVVQSR